MKIQNINVYSQPNFESRRLYKAKVYWYSKINNKIVPEDVYISEINKDDILNLSRTEQDKINSEEYGRDIISEILNLPDGEYGDEEKFFAIEAPKADGVKIRALARATDEKDYDTDEKTIYINFLQSYKHSKKWEIHGAGSSLIYGIIDAFARKRQAKSVSLTADRKAMDFYEKIGFTTTEKQTPVYRIKKERFKKIKPVIREKYSIQKIKDTDSL